MNQSLNHKLRLASVSLALATPGLAACDGSEERPDPHVTMADLDLEGQSFSDVVPVEFQSEIRRPDAENNGQRDRDAPPIPTATIFSTVDNSLFPMPRSRREFASQDELIQFVADRFGATELTRDGGKLVGAQGSYVRVGTSFFEDESIGIRFEVTDPVLAFLGGVSGEVQVGEDRMCLDPDGDCGTERASYLNPVGDTTAATREPLCDRGVCVEFHSFFNRTSFPFPWARHGSNVRFTTYSALPSTRLSTGGTIHVPPGIPGVAITHMLPFESNQGQDSVESASWCIGDTTCAAYVAVAVCGLGSVTDQDVNGSMRTGNGPANNSVCPG